MKNPFRRKRRATFLNAEVAEIFDALNRGEAVELDTLRKYPKTLKAVYPDAAETIRQYDAYRARQKEAVDAERTHYLNPDTPHTFTFADSIHTETRHMSFTDDKTPDDIVQIAVTREQAEDLRACLLAYSDLLKTFNGITHGQLPRTLAAIVDNEIEAQ